MPQIDRRAVLQGPALGPAAAATATAGNHPASPALFDDEAAPAADGSVLFRRGSGLGHRRPSSTGRGR